MKYGPCVKSLCGRVDQVLTDLPYQQKEAGVRRHQCPAQGEGGLDDEHKFPG